MAKHNQKGSHRPAVGKIAHLQATKKKKQSDKWPETNLRGANPRKY